MHADEKHILDILGQTDIYLIDQLQKKRLKKEMHILDAGCGGGRNLQYFLSLKFPNIYGADHSAEAVSQILKLKNELHPELPNENFVTATIDELPFEEEQMDAVLSIAVLHFAKDEAHFQAMLDEMWRVLRQGGMLFCRLASSIGIENRIEKLEGRRALLPDGSKRFLVDETYLLRHTHRLGATFLEPIKTVNVQNSRCMTTWVIGKR